MLLPTELLPKCPHLVYKDESLDGHDELGHQHLRKRLEDTRLSRITESTIQLVSGPRSWQLPRSLDTRGAKAQPPTVSPLNC